ncbi:helix-turn-helix domain-containing protein [Gorillibacterium timonense]|uniref:helix-turn-helix domain-containing protein n=1 Tax=Gorillibacterium timonense TaxID=1689269 RepID=UPI00071CE5B9|nr:MerR family transcriptional regulator [Gorillibacterium timonense]
MSVPLFKVREVSLKYDITTRALKYYEEMGLITSTHVEDYSYRCYDAEAVKRIEQILILRKLDISIKDIQRIFASANAAVLIDVLGEKIGKIDHETELLQHVKTIIIALIEQIQDFDTQDEVNLKLLYEKANEVGQYIEGYQDAVKAQPVHQLIEAVDKLEKKPDIRIVNLPSVRMARSGKNNLEAFDKWFSTIKPPQNLFPRDFMWFHPQLNDFEWLFALPEDMTDSNGFEVFDFPGGLYAAAVAFDDDDVTRVNRLVHRWVDESQVYAASSLENDEFERYDMGHIIGAMHFADGTMKEQMDLFIPIVKKQHDLSLRGHET